MSENKIKTAWHNLSHEDACRQLNVNEKSGLDAVAVEENRKKYGWNKLTPKKQYGELMRFLLQFNAPLVYILIGSTIVTAILGEWVDSSVIFGVVMLNAIIGYIQEAKAEKSIDALAKMVITEATVRRNGKKVRLASAELVPGDIVLLQSGDKVPADLRLIKIRELQVDESALTGESVPVEKISSPLESDTILAERKNLTFAGTLVSRGQAEGVVFATGDKTEMGRIATMVAEAVDLSTPLTRKIAEFSNFLLIVIMSLAVLTFVIGMLRGNSVIEMFMAAVALAVGAIPEGLPAAVTITLAVGVSRMAKQRAIIRKLPAVETLGSTSVICSDKTGTLTENQMTVQLIYAGGVQFTVTGVGYDSRGEIQQNDSVCDINKYPVLKECLTAGILCNDSQLVNKNGKYTVNGDPTEGCLFVAAHKAGMDEHQITTANPRIDSIPFESEHQYMATMHKQNDGKSIIYVKGAVEKIIERCSDALDEHGNKTTLVKADIVKFSEDLAASGLRVLAFASMPVNGEMSPLNHKHIASGLSFIGLQAMIDPPRPEAIAAIKKCRTAGIEVKMITGDHILTASAIAQKIGLGHSDATTVAITGRELEEYSDTELIRVANETTVFARVAPEQKLRLVKALQAGNNIVAMTGDGVNDAPALKQADIGIAMGITGTDVAKGAADMLLIDDNFASIEAAVEEGRNVFDNLTKFIVWTLPTNFGEGLIILAAIIAGTVLPVLPVQVLYINMVTAVLLGLMLVFEPKELDLMQRKPRDHKASIMTPALIFRTSLVTALILAGAFGLFVWEQAHGASLAEARTVAVNVIVMVELFYLFNCRSLTQSMFSVGLFSNRWLLSGVTIMIALQMLITYQPTANKLFHTAPLGMASWWRILAVSMCAYIIVGIEKWIRNWHSQRKQNQ
jgi:Ca2+-transporting ATPase